MKFYSNRLDFNVRRDVGRVPDRPDEPAAEVVRVRLRGGAGRPVPPAAAFGAIRSPRSWPLTRSVSSRRRRARRRSSPVGDAWTRGSARPGRRPVEAGPAAPAAQQGGDRRFWPCSCCSCSPACSPRCTRTTSPTSVPTPTTSRARSTSAASSENVVSLDGVPIGPTFTSHYFFGADTNGRDLAVRLLYGGRTSLIIGVVATADHHHLRHPGRAAVRVLPRHRGRRAAAAHGADLVLPAGDPRRRASAPRWPSAGSGRSRATRS